ncbi:hypothetical protein [Olleya sp. HaHaR_3_96]|uniref:hypothetical protein n=1 Tax=Olleya sp. HaHaR_3_96 TaxID=2745560 RepID=UPI001C4FFE5C|nr:hypothetical protein [Olleya sp. HaHaR_3_96]QXP61028.1 hypothetical protein H0I26_05165 [Olleya sp. HaHaR_3_96]
MISAITAKITTFVLVFILLANNINTMVIVADFVINQDQIAKTLCVQKEDQKGCNGKCQLRKDLTENNPESDPDIPLQGTKRISLDVYCPASIFTLETEPIEPIVLKQNIHFSDLKVSKMYLDIDTPPPNFS